MHPIAKRFTILIVLSLPVSKPADAVHAARLHISDFTNPLTKFNPFVDLQEGNVSRNNNPRVPLTLNEVSSEIRNPDLNTNNQNGLNDPSFSENIDEVPKPQPTLYLSDPLTGFNMFTGLEEGNVTINSSQASIEHGDNIRNPDHSTNNQNVLEDPSFSENGDADPTGEPIPSLMNPLTGFNPLFDPEEGNVSYKHPQIPFEPNEVMNDVSSQHLISDNQNDEEQSVDHISDFKSPTTVGTPFVDLQESNVTYNMGVPSKVIDEVKSSELLTKIVGTNDSYISGDGDDQHISLDLTQGQQEQTQLSTLEPNKNVALEKYNTSVNETREFNERITGIKNYTDTASESNSLKNTTDANNFSTTVPSILPTPFNLSALKPIAQEDNRVTTSITNRDLKLKQPNLLSILGRKGKTGTRLIDIPQDKGQDDQPYANMYAYIVLIFIISAVAFIIFFCIIRVRCTKMAANVNRVQEVISGVSFTPREEE